MSSRRMTTFLVCEGVTGLAFIIFSVINKPKTKRKRKETISSVKKDQKDWVTLHFHHFLHFQFVLFFAQWALCHQQPTKISSVLS